MDGKLPLGGTFVFHAPPSLEAGSFHKTRYSSIAGCRHRWAWLTLTSLSFPVPEAIISVSYLLKEPDPVVPHRSGGFAETPEMPQVVGLQPMPQLWGEPSHIGKWAGYGFNSSSPGLLLTQMRASVWHHEGDDGGKGWQGLRHYQEKKHWRITSLSHRVTSCFKSRRISALDILRAAAGLKNSECFQTPNNTSLLLVFWLCSTLFLYYFFSFHLLIFFSHPEK